MSDLRACATRSRWPTIHGQTPIPARDFDADLTAIDPRYVDAHVGNPHAKLTIVLGVEDAERLQQLAARRHQRPAEVVADPDLLRSA